MSTYSNIGVLCRSFPTARTYTNLRVLSGYCRSNYANSFLYFGISKKSSELVKEHLLTFLNPISEVFFFFIYYLH
nr:MAG TPA: hypothetical protein [Bacteriophage sp.]